MTLSVHVGEGVAERAQPGRDPDGTRPGSGGQRDTRPPVLSLVTTICCSTLKIDRAVRCPESASARAVQSPMRARNPAAARTVGSTSRTTSWFPVDAPRRPLTPQHVPQHVLVEREVGGQGLRPRQVSRETSLPAYELGSGSSDGR